jgi:hypothetical protein
MDLPGMWSHSDFTGGYPDERSHAERRWSTGVPEPQACRLGRVEYDGARYCHEHGGFLEPGVQSLQCNLSAPTEAATSEGER